ncbi:large subunit ribosomal protein L25 [Litorivivens lipolytica]|uniref:Large ribosomal subunit protein bL25 n=1 Tax=Litorivivens lipolytica TaxID=1524264 RepID=A0A7W4W594_9GAMM|nr:50S ribosomal protein L25/general stress protein Ctc [Litorivivens lipolytica]MBB3047144.1 large subunit ribosomal protein L25 [Litorivivens lipolytica]
MSEYTLNAKVRQDAGKGASRRLRRLANEVPAIVYGGKKDPMNISVLQKDLIKDLEDESFYTSLITLEIDGAGSEQVVLKDLQRHPSKAQITHADFLRVDATTKITMRVPLHFINEEKCHGVKMQGGIVAHAMTELEVTCLPKDLPEFIEVDMLNVEVGQTLHISDLTLPEGVESVALSHGEDHDLPVANVVTPRGGVQEDDAAEEGGDDAAEEKSED